MKTRYHALILLLIIVISAIVFYSYKRKQYLSLNPEDKQIIIKSFNPDSNGKGYSDEGQKMMDEDDKKMVKLNKVDKQRYLNLYANEMKLIRIVVLSKDRENYFDNLRLFYKNRYCLDLYLVKANDRETNYNVFDKFGVGETRETVDYFYILKNKYLKTLNSESIDSIIDIEQTHDECAALGDIKL